ncbi:MAG: hypothetical protein JJT96_11970 [Opitutales bacterium]|nr:hypothetical protein [Opitutales bacterium]
MPKNVQRLGAYGLVALLGLPAVSASDIDVGVLLDILVEKGVLTRDEVDRAIERSQRATAQAQPPPVVTVPFEPTEALSDRPANTRVRRFGVETADGQDRFRIRGRFQLDYGYVDWDNAFATIDGDLSRYGTLVRRARLGALGVWNRDWEWQMEVDFRDNEIRFANTYIAWLGMHDARLAVGNFKEPISMESSTSSRRVTFLERAAPIDAYRPDREMGVLYETLREDYYVGLGVFGGEGVTSERRIHEGYSLAGRGSYAIVNETDHFLHIGGSLNYRKNAYRARAGRNREYVDVRLRTRTGTRTVDGRLIGRNDVANVRFIERGGLEVAGGTGPYAFQAEYIQARLDRDFGLPTLSFSGWYAQTMWNITGESHNYRATSGDFGLPRVNKPFGTLDGGPGLWQVAFRFATADSISHDHDGHKMDHWTLGFNWYPIPEIVFKLNLMRFEAENAAGQRTRGNAIGFRAQLEF